MGLATTALLASVAATRPAVAEGSDPWFGADKTSHFAVSGIVAMGGYVIGSAFVDGQAGPLLIGGGVAMTAGIGKEVADLVGPGTASWKDLAWDAIGTVTGLALAWSASLLHRTLWPPKEKPSVAAPTWSPLVSF